MMRQYGALAGACALAGLLILCPGRAESQILTPLFIDAQWNSSTGISNYHYGLYLSPNSVANSSTAFTFFDFSGMFGTPTFVPTAAGANFAISTPLLGPNLPGTGQADLSNVANVALRYDGTTITNAATSTNPLLLGDVTINSLVKLYTLAPYTEFAGNVTESTTGQGASNSGETWGPNQSLSIVQSTGTPEPGPLALLVGLGLTGLKAFSRRRKANSA